MQIIKTSIVDTISIIICTVHFVVVNTANCKKQDIAEKIYLHIN